MDLIRIRQILIMTELRRRMSYLRNMLKCRMIFHYQGPMYSNCAFSKMTVLLYCIWSKTKCNQCTCTISIRGLFPPIKMCYRDGHPFALAPRCWTFDPNPVWWTLEKLVCRNRLLFFFLCPAFLEYDGRGSFFLLT